MWVARAVTGAVTMGALLIVLFDGARVPPQRADDCLYEDQLGCSWDASTQGNGYGRSFRSSSDGVVTYGDAR